MFKLVVLCAFLAAATADPAAVVAPLAYSTNVVLPSPAYYSSPSSLVYSSPLVSPALAYSNYGYPHFIKKRSLAVSSYIAPSTYVASAPLINTYGPLATSYAAPFTTTYAGPLATTYASPFYPTTHLIKKRSAPLIVPSTYVAPAHYAASPYVAAPYVAASYSASPVVSTPYISSAPLAYTHFIKKRSAPLAVATYAAPTSFSHQSRFDFQATSPAITTYSTYAGSPLVYPSTVGVTHLI